MKTALEIVQERYKDVPIAPKPAPEVEPETPDARTTEILRTSMHTHLSEAEYGELHSAVYACVAAGLADEASTILTLGEAMGMRSGEW